MNAIVFLFSFLAVVVTRADANPEPQRIQALEQNESGCGSPRLLSHWANVTRNVGDRAILRCPLDTRDLFMKRLKTCRIRNTCLVDWVEWYRSPYKPGTGLRSWQLLRGAAVKFDPLLVFFSQVEDAQNGWYTCVVGNAEGRSEISTYLHVLPAGESLPASVMKPHGPRRPPTTPSPPRPPPPPPPISEESRNWQMSAPVMKPSQPPPPPPPPPAEENHPQQLYTKEEYYAQLRNANINPSTGTRYLNRHVAQIGADNALHSASYVGETGGSRSRQHSHEESHSSANWPMVHQENVAAAPFRRRPEPQAFTAASDVTVSSASSSGSSSSSSSVSSSGIDPLSDMREHLTMLHDKVQELIERMQITEDKVHNCGCT